MVLTCYADAALSRVKCYTVTSLVRRGKSLIIRTDSRNVYINLSRVIKLVINGQEVDPNLLEEGVIICQS
jgi:hypothetical protein